MNRRRGTIWLAILGYGLVASGLPLPLGGVLPGVADAAAARRLAGKDRSQPFPCMDKPCGCATAEQCFTNCCCHTPSQTLAWARAHRVSGAVLSALERRAASAARPAAGGCCAAPQNKTPGPSCCAAAGDACADAVARGDSFPLAAEPTATTDPAEQVRPERPAVGTVVLRDMLACGGIVAQWCSAGAAPPPKRIDVPFLMGRVATLRVADLIPVCRADDLDAPPPRAA